MVRRMHAASGELAIRRRHFEYSFIQTEKYGVFNTGNGVVNISGARFEIPLLFPAQIQCVFPALCKPLLCSAPEEPALEYRAL